MTRWKRAASAILALLTTTTVGVITLAAPAAANGDSLWFRIGSGMPTTATYGANAAIRIGGKFYFKNSGCPDDGVPDFVYPTSDVYIVVPGTEQGHLVDATGGPPNTIVQYGSIFDDEIIGITSPSGRLGAGVYDVVFDTCQDGIFDPEVDTFFSRVLTVEMPAGDLPAPDPALESLKAASYDEYQSWKNTQRVMNGVWKLVERALKAGCKAGNPTACALKYGNYFSPIQEQFNGLLLNQGQHYLAIYEDPPNPDFAHPVVLERPADGSALAGEAAVTQALLRAVEAYKGAQAAGDREWALAHAIEARDLHDTLASQAQATAAQLQGIADLYTDAADEGIVYARKFLSRVWMSGFTPDERRALAENGMSRAEITAYETALRSDVQPHWTASVVRGALAETIATHANSVAAIADGRAAWAAIVDSLGAQSSRPVADAGGTYDAVEGAPVTLDGTASTGAASYDWDVDGDRDFDDASGPLPQVTFDVPGSPVVGLRIADADGRTSYDWATVRVSASSATPTVTRTAPQGVLVMPTVSTPTQFAVSAGDDTGTPTVTWSVDGGATGATGPSYTWTAPAAAGVHQVTATATDADGHAARVSWDVLVRAVDGDKDDWTAITDCDDTDAAVHPGQLEFLGNGVDDDCDAGTPDAPVGGLTGTPWAWGHPQYNATGRGTFSNASYQLPMPTTLGDDVVAIEQGHGAGWAVLADGSVRAWGYATDGQLGNDTVGAAAYTPVQPKGPGGQGVLTGVRMLEESNAHVAAVRTDGTVVTWGRNNLGNLGDGSTTAYRAHPDLVLTSPSGPPLTGVKSVDVGYQADYALMADGSVMAWGYVACDGDADTAPYTRFPKKIEQLDGVRQISAGANIVLFLMKDGRVLSCGGTDPQLGRKWAFNEAQSAYRPRQVDGLGAGSGVVDVTIYGDSAAVLKEDGTVWIWGENTNASLGPVCGLPDCTLFSPTRAPMPAGAPIVDIDNDNSSTTLALRTDGTMLAWGGNTYGAAGLGDLPGSDFVPTPTVVDVGGRHIVAISSSVWNGMALTRPADDPTLPVPARHVTASIADATVTEAGDAAFRVTLSEAHSAPIELDYVVTGDAADVVLGSGTVVVPAGATAASIPVDVVDDAIDEDDESFTVAISGARLGLTVERAQATGTIVDDDEAPTVSVGSVTVAEGSTSLTDLAVHLRLSAPSGKEVVTTWATADGTATAGEDYVAASAEARFAPGETDHVVHLSVTGDTVVEPDEAFTVGVAAVDNGVAGAGATVTIADDEALALSVQSPTVTEGTGGTTPATFTVSVSPAPAAGQTVEVPWSVVEPAAGDGDLTGDVVAAAGTVRLTHDQPSAGVVVQVVGDDLVEGREFFGLELGEPVASDGRVVLTGRAGPAVIVDDDVADTPPPAWPFDGFFAPVDNLPVVNVVKAGSAVPMKFGLGGYRGMDILAPGSPASAQKACGTGASDVLESTATPGSSTLSYDATTGRYQYVWQTSKAWAGTCRQFVLTLADGSSHVAEFRFR